MTTAGWMMFAWLLTWFFGAIVMPSSNALMSQRVAADAQGELQGAVAGIYSLSSIGGPLLMSQVFGRFAAPDARPHVPGAAFFTAALLAAGCFALYVAATRTEAAAATPVITESA